MSREMKDSGVEWIGEIPKSWNIIKIKNAFVRKKSKPTTENYNILSLARSGIKIRDISTGVGQIANDYSHYNPVIPGDILLNPMDLVSGDNSNISEVEGVISQAYFNLRTKNGYDPYFYNYYFKLQYWLGSFFSHGKGVSFENRWTLNAETISNFPVVTPSLAEQNMIVNHLNEKIHKIETIVEKTKKSIAELKEYKQSLITETVTKGLNPDAPMKDSGIEWIGEVPKHWDVVSLSMVSNSYSGGTPKRNVERYWNNGTIPWISSGEVNKEIINDSNELITEEGLNESSAKLFPPRTVLVALNGQGKTKGMSALLEIEASTNQSLVGFIPSNNLNYKYLHYTFIAAYSFNRSYYAGGDKRDGIAAGNLKKRKIPFPSLDVQLSIVKYIEEKIYNVEKLIENKNKLINELEIYKQSLIYEYVTGKKEVE